MKPAYLVLAVAASAAAFWGIVTLISSVATTCLAMTNAIAALVFVVSIVAAAHCWVNGLGIKIQPHIKHTSV